MTTTSSARESQLMAEINITPFTDVLLVLLIIFMILAAFTAPPGFQKQFSHPQPKHTPYDVIEHNQILVEVTATNRISVDGKMTPFGRLYDIMATTIALHDRHGFSRHITLIANANANFDTIIKILDAARQAGDDDVAFVMQ